MTVGARVRMKGWAAIPPPPRDQTGPLVTYPTNAPPLTSPPHEDNPPVGRPYSASDRPRPAYAAAPQGDKSGRAWRNPPHGPVADRYHPRSRSQSLPCIIQPPWRLSTAMAR